MTGSFETGPFARLRGFARASPRFAMPLWVACRHAAHGNPVETVVIHVGFLSDQTSSLIWQRHRFGDTCQSSLGDPRHCSVTGLGRMLHRCAGNRARQKLACLYSAFANYSEVRKVGILLLPQL